MESLNTFLILGLLQGLLEWLPISSQGNLVLLMVSLLGLEPSESISLSVYLHAGTGLAALIYFREDVVGILGRDSERKRHLFAFLVVATVTTGIVGLPLFVFARFTSFFGEALLGLVGVSLVITGLIQRESRERGSQTSGSLRLIDGLYMGLVQGLSAIPGLSRSGLTTSALLLCNYDGEEAYRISFLMSIPAVFAATLGLMFLEGVPPFQSGFIVAIIASFISALLSIEALLRLARRLRFWSLCVILGVLALIPQILHLM